MTRCWLAFGSAVLVACALAPHALSDDAASRVRVELEGIPDLTGASVRPFFADGRAGSAHGPKMDVTLDAESSARRLPPWGADRNLYAVLLEGGGLPTIHASRPDPTARPGRYPAWRLESRGGIWGDQGRMEVALDEGVATWRVRLDPAPRWIPIRCRRGAETVRCRVTDLWTCETYAARDDGLAYIMLRAEQTTGFLVLPEGGSPLRLLPSDLAARPGTVLELDASARGRDVHVRVDAGEGGPERTKRLEGFVWDGVTGGLVCDAVGAVGEALTFSNVLDGPIVVVAQVHLSGGGIWMGAWEGDSTRDVSLRLEPAEYWYERWETGVRATSTAVRADEVEMDVLPYAAAGERPCRADETRIVPGRYRVRRTRSKVTTEIPVEVRQGVCAVVPRR